MNEHPTVLPIDHDEAEREALTAAVATARADPRPGVPHEQVRADMLREIERLRRKINGAGSRRRTATTHRGFPAYSSVQLLRFSHTSSVRLLPGPRLTPGDFWLRAAGVALAYG